MLAYLCRKPLQTGMGTAPVPALRQRGRHRTRQSPQYARSANGPEQPFPGAVTGIYRPGMAHRFWPVPRPRHHHPPRVRHRAPEVAACGCVVGIVCVRWFHCCLPGRSPGNS